jgi:hypothetical protein
VDRLEALSVVQLELDPLEALLGLRLLALLALLAESGTLLQLELDLLLVLCELELTLLELELLVLRLLKLMLLELALEKLLEVTLLTLLELDGLELDEDKSSIERIDSRLPVLGPGNCRLPVWNANTSGVDTSPVVFVSVSTACQIVLSANS